MPAATQASKPRALVGRVSAASEPASTAAHRLLPVSRRVPRIPAPAAASRPRLPSPSPATGCSSSLPLATPFFAPISAAPLPPHPASTAPSLRVASHHWLSTVWLTAWLPGRPRLPAVPVGWARAEAAVACRQLIPPPRSVVAVTARILASISVCSLLRDAKKPGAYMRTGGRLVGHKGCEPIMSCVNVRRAQQPL